MPEEGTARTCRSRGWAGVIFMAALRLPAAAGAVVPVARAELPLALVLFSTSGPLAATAYHSAPKSRRPSPVVWPARLSPTKVQSGWPA
jgi:hypothetical protein